SDELLMSYEAGSLAEGWSLAVATHLQSCPECQARARAAASIGGAMLDAIDIAPLRAGALSAVLKAIDADPIEIPESRRRPPAAGDVPAPLQRYIGPSLDSVAWRKLGTMAHQFIIPTGDSETSV